MKSKISKAQISLEYLIILAVAFSLLSLFLYGANDFTHKAQMSLEKQKVKQFYENLDNAIAELNLFGENSSKILKIENKLPWLIKVNSQDISITVISEKSETAGLTSELFGQVICKESEILCEKCFIILKKSKGFIQLEFTDKQ
ncbi:MAG: hypothetical protein COT15_00965 [Candidatus Diapherotrites archaeon CG08_land_8_20_14_0_20_34_12]|nr:MAG: hypothetical protein COT15_00965 [Candidatus Diapherotrites archaeon CG08_land_8_20_14_0_20_34_12]